MKVERLKAKKCKPIEELLCGEVFEWGGDLLITTNECYDCDGENRRRCVRFVDGSVFGFRDRTMVLTADAKVVEE